MPPLTPHQQWVLKKLELVQRQRALDREYNFQHAKLADEYKQLMANEPEKLPQDIPKELSE